MTTDPQPINRLLDELSQACQCEETICLACRASECIDELLIGAILNYYQGKRRTWRCHR